MPTKKVTKKVTMVDEEAVAPVVEGAALIPEGPEYPEQPLEFAPQEVEPESELSDDEGEEEVGLELEDLDPEMPLWENGPLVKEALEWKSQHRLYLTSFTMEDHVMWRPMDRDEYRDHVRRVERMAEEGYSQSEANLMNEERIAELCILFPPYDAKQKREGLAGIPSVIAQSVMEASGFVALEVREL